MGFCGLPFVYTLINLFGSTTFGYAITYPSSAIPEIRKVMEITLFESTFFNSITSLCGMIGALSAQFFIKFFGNKVSTCVIGVFGCIFATALPFMTLKNIWLGILARALIGVVIGFVSAIIPQNIKIIAPPEYMSIYGSLNQFGICFGGMICLFFSDYMNWKVLSYTHAGIFALLSIFICFVPLKSNTKESISKNESIFQKKYIGKLIVAILIMLFQQWSGVNGIVSNLNDLFVSAKIDMSLGLASGIAQSAQVIAALIGSLLIYKFGRKTIWILSEIGCVLFLLLYSLSIKLNGWPPILSIVFIFLYLLLFGIGIGPIPWFIVPEIFPSSVVSSAVSIGTMFNWIFSFTVIFTFQYLVKYLTYFGSMFIYLGICFLGIIFGYFYITNGTSVEDGITMDSKDDYNVYEEPNLLNDESQI